MNRMNVRFFQVSVPFPDSVWHEISCKSQCSYIMYMFITQTSHGKKATIHHASSSHEHQIQRTLTRL